MRFLKKIINKFRPKSTIKKVVAPVQTSEAIYSAEEIAKIIPTEVISMSKENVLKNSTKPEKATQKQALSLEKLRSDSGKSKVNISNLDNELKIKNIARPKPRFFTK